MTPITARTKLRWPTNDILTDYLVEFGQKQVDAGVTGVINFQTTVNVIKRAEPADGLATQFTLELEKRSGEKSEVSCETVIMATGLAIPVMPNTYGVEHAETYEDIPEDQEYYEQKKVVVFGLGNAAFETANAMAPYVDYVHVFPGRHKAVRAPMVSWEARYPGGVRAINTNLYDAYLLKSLDGGMASNVYADATAIVPCGEGKKKKCLFPYRASERYKAADVLDRPGDPATTLGLYCTSNAWADDFVNKLEVKYPGILDIVKESRNMVGVTDVHPKDGGTIVHRRAIASETYQLTVPLSVIQEGDNVDDFAEFGSLTGGPYPLTYDHVILCLGVKHDMRFYDESTTPMMQPNKKYPVMTHAYESLNQPGLFFVSKADDCF